MERYEVHVCLVSQQLLPNLLLCCDDIMRPDLVVLVITKVMRKQGELLTTLIRQQGCKIEIIEIDSYDINLLQQVVSEILTKFSTLHVAVNVTGGNKLMALAAFMESWSRNVPAFYVDTDTDIIWQLGEHTKQFSAPDLLKVNLYLHAYGYRIVSSGGKSIRPILVQLAKELADDFEGCNDAIKSLNYYASKAKNSLSVQISASDLRKKHFEQLLVNMNASKLLCHDNGNLIFANEEARFFVNGGWLEQHVFWEVQQLQREGRICDVVLNGVIEDNEGTKNEIDVMFTARNRLFMIECKTKNMNQNNARVDDMLYKLESIKGLVGGLYGQAMLLSYFPIQAADRKRCKSYNIALIEGRLLKDLRSKLCTWINAAGSN